MPTLILAVLLAGIGATAALAHGGDQPTPGWTFDPWIVTPLALFGALYASGLGAILRRCRNAFAIARRGVLGLVGWASLCAALLSPLHWLGERLFTFHMIEHEILMAVSAPLLVAARPLALVLWGLPRQVNARLKPLLAAPAARSAWRWLTDGSTATLLHAIAIWGWHVPTLFDAAVTNAMLHRLQHLSFFATAVLFWWAVLWRSGRGVATWHLFVTMMHTAVLGVLMTLAPRVLYVAQTQSAADWGMTSLEDQQLAGVVMWIPAGTVYAGAALAMAALWIHQSSRGGTAIDHA
jgi:putative membrane protein